MAMSEAEKFEAHAKAVNEYRERFLSEMGTVPPIYAAVVDLCERAARDEREQLDAATRNLK